MPAAYILACTHTCMHADSRPGMLADRHAYMYIYIETKTEAEIERDSARERPLKLIQALVALVVDQPAEGG